MSNIVKVDYNDDQELLLQIFKQKTEFRKILTILGDESNTVQDALLEIRDNYWIDTAEGVQLDVLGEIQDIEREGRDDTEYREAIKVKIVLNIGSGEPETIIFALTRLFEAGVARLSNIGNATVQIWVDIILTQDEYDLIQSLCPAGVKLYLSVGSENPFGFSTDPEAAGFGWSGSTEGGEYQWTLT